MAKMTLESEREYTKRMVEQSSLDGKRKGQMLDLIPKLNRSQLAKVRLQMRKFYYLDISNGIVDEWAKSDQVPENDDVIWNDLYKKLMEKEKGFLEGIARG